MSSFQHEKQRLQFKTLSKNFPLLNVRFENKSKSVAEEDVAEKWQHCAVVAKILAAMFIQGRILLTHLERQPRFKV